MENTTDRIQSTDQTAEALFSYYYEKLMKQLEFDRDVPDEEILNCIDHLLTARDRFVPLARKSRLRKDLFNAVRRLDILQELIDDDTVTEIMVNGTEAIYIERGGKLRRWNKRFSSKEKLTDIASRIAASCNRSVNELNPIADARLDNGARVNIVMAPVAIDGPVITIRRFPDKPIRMEDLIEWGSITREAAQFLETVVSAGYNIFISGGTGSGKTTFLNALAEYIPEEERIITIEDNAELQLRHVKNLVRLEARTANEEGTGEITIRDLIRSSLRMRPDRIIVGEVRGPETIDMLTAFNTGHDGSLSTGHGNNARDMLFRLETMYAMGLKLSGNAIRRQISTGIDLMVHLGRLRNHTRKVLEILEIDGYDYTSEEILTHTLFEFREEAGEREGPVTGKLIRTGELRRRDKLERAGIITASTVKGNTAGQTVWKEGMK